MSEVEIEVLKQNTSALVAEAVAGEIVTITDRGRPVAQITAIPKSRLRRLIELGHARPARSDINDLPAPEPGPSLSNELAAMHDSERY